MSTKNGFGIVEIVVALGLFAVIGVTGLTLILHSFTANRLGIEQTQASNLASSGLDIVRNLRIQSYSNLVNGAYGLKNVAGLWSLTTTPETWEKYTRTITVNDAQRDGGGNLVDTGGTTDTDVKKVTATVAWNVSPTRSNSVIYSTYLTNYAKPITTLGDGFLAWGDTTTTPKWTHYTANTDTFSTKTNLMAGESALSVVSKTSPTKAEALVGYTSASGTLHILCYNGTSWSEDWSVNVGGTSTTRRFDLAYEKASGDAMIVYSTNASGTTELGYRTKPGTSSCGSGNWSTHSGLDPLRTTGIVHWVKLAEDARVGQSTLALSWADSNSDLSVMLWDGTTWVNEPTATTEANLERIVTPQDVETFALAFESLSGNLMLIWGTNVAAGTNGVRYRRCTGGTATCSWGAVTTPPTFADDATNLDLAANTASNEMIFASIGNAQNDLQVGHWNGTSWTNTANRDTSCTTPISGSKKVAAGWLISGATTRSIVVYDDQGSGFLNWIIGNGTTFTIQTDFTPTPTFATNQGWYSLVHDPNNPNQLLFIVADSANDLFAKRIAMTNTPTFTWSNSGGGTTLELNLSQNRTSPYSYSPWRH